MGNFIPDDYEPVEDRIAKFWSDHADGRLLTTLVQYEAGEVIVRAEAYRDAADERPATVGYAHEKVGDGPVNRTSALENCETSAIGRALANLGYATRGARPSREEMAKVERAKKKPPAKKAPAKVLPDGWESQEDCDNAHDEAAAAAKKLPAAKKKELTAFKDEHGWPMSLDDLVKFNGLVTVLEQT